MKNGTFRLPRLQRIPRHIPKDRNQRFYCLLYLFALLSISTRTYKRADISSKNQFRIDYFIDWEGHITLLFASKFRAFASSYLFGALHINMLKRLTSPALLPWFGIKTLNSWLWMEIYKTFRTTTSYFPFLIMNMIIIIIIIILHSIDSGNVDTWPTPL